VLAQHLSSAVDGVVSVVEPDAGGG
jgi:hypothetical protein